MARFCWLITLLLTYAISKGTNIIAQAEEYYEQREYDKLVIALKEIDERKITSEESGTVNRLKGHICMFGQGRDQNVDLGCAWKHYAVAAKKGDAESYFYVGFMLNNFLFEDISVLRDLFEDIDLATVLEPAEAIEKVKATASVCYYLSSLKGYLPATMAMGYKKMHRIEGCEASMKYYNKAAEMLLANYNKTVYMNGVSHKYILTKADPYHEKEEDIDPEYALRTLSSTRIDKLNVFVSVALYLFGSKRFDESKAVINQILSYQPSHQLANYYLGLMEMLGLDSSLDYEKAIKHLSAGEYQEAANAMGVLYLEGYGVSRNSTIAKKYFKEAAKNGSAYGAFNTFMVLVEEVGTTSEEALLYLIQAAKKGHPKASYIVGLLKFHANNSCGGIQYLKNATEGQLWETYYKDVYNYYISKQKKVATLYYMIMGKIGNPISQVNAANLLDEHEFFTGKSWLSKLNNSWSLDKHLAFKFYKLAESQGETVVYKRLSDFYYFGLAPEADTGMYYFYLLQALIHKNSLSTLAQISFDLGVACQFDLVPDHKCDYTIQAYNLSSVLHPSGYVPATIMMRMAEWWEKGIWPNLCSIKIIPYIMLVIWLIVPFVFIYKRRL